MTKNRRLRIALAGSALLTLGSITATGTAFAEPGSSGEELAGSDQLSSAGSSAVGSSATGRPWLHIPMPDVDPKGFYASIGTTAEGEPGEILNKQPSKFALGLPNFDWTGSKAELVAYVSTNAVGEKIPVTGTVLQSSKEWKGEGPRPLLVIAPGTQGAGNKCAPGKLLPQGLEYEALPVAQALLRGWNVALTDLPGLGTKAEHTYMNRVDQGNATLDMARAAKNLNIPSITDDTPIATWGYSQGGGASAAALELAASYAPELNLKAGYAGGIPADLAVVATTIDNGTLAGALGYTINGLLYQDPSLQPDVDRLMNKEGKRLLALTKDECTVETVLRHAYVDTSKLTITGESITEALEREPFKTAVGNQLIGDLPPSVPVYVGHGTNDDTIPVSQSRNMARKWAEGGTKVYYQEHDLPALAPLVDHALPMMTHMNPAILWLEDVIQGKKFPETAAADIPAADAARP